MFRETEGPQAVVCQRLGESRCKPSDTQTIEDDALSSLALPEILFCLLPFPPQRMNTAARDKRRANQLFLRLLLLLCGKKKALTFELFSGRHLENLRRHRCRRPLCVKGG